MNTTTYTIRVIRENKILVHAELAKLRNTKKLFFKKEKRKDTGMEFPQNFDGKNTNLASYPYPLDARRNNKLCFCRKPTKNAICIVSPRCK